MLLLSLLPAALALPLDFLLADDPFLIARYEQEFSEAAHQRGNLRITEGARSRCLEAPVVYYATEAVAADLGAVAALTRCWLPDVPVDRVMTGASPARASGCFVHLGEEGADYACAEGTGTLLLSVETPAAVSEAWLAARFGQRGTPTGSTAEQSFEAWGGPMTTWLRLRAAPVSALLGAQANATRAIQDVEPDQMVSLWRAGRRESESAILALDPGLSEVGELVFAIRPDSRMVAVASLTPRGAEIWSKLQPVRLPRWTGPDHDLRMEIGADLGAMARLAAGTEAEDRERRDLVRDCGSICALTTLLGSPASLFFSTPLARDIDDAVGLLALWTLNRRERDMHVVTQSAGEGDVRADPAFRGLLESVFDDLAPAMSRERGFVLIESGDSHWGKPAPLEPGVRITVLDPAGEDARRIQILKELKRMPVQLQGPMTAALTVQGNSLRMATNGADLQIEGASEPLAVPWTDQESYRCLRELVEQDPVRRPIDWEARWLPEDVPSLVEQSMSKAEACRARSPENGRLIDHLEAGYQTMLGLYLLEHARFAEARAPLQAACGRGEWLACEISSVLPAQSPSADRLPVAPVGLNAAPPTAPLWSLAQGKVSAAAQTCGVGDRACLTRLHGGTAPLLLLSPDTTAGEVATLLGALPPGEESPGVWLAGWDGAHLVARKIGLDQQDPEGTVALAPGSAASALLTLAPERAVLWFGVDGRR